MIFTYEYIISEDTALGVVHENTLVEEIFLSGLEFVGRSGDNLKITFNEELSPEDLLALDTIVNEHVGPSMLYNISGYIDSSVFPFITELIRRFIAENIAMGVTQIDKSGEVLGLFRKPFDVKNNGLPYSIKDTFDTGSLYESIRVLKYLRANPSAYEGFADQFINDLRLKDLLNRIELFLGLEASE